MQPLIIADDLTGACDTAIAMHRPGETVRVSLGARLPALWAQSDVLAVNTRTRAMSADQAFQTVYQTVSRLREAGLISFYKKLDSRFRGNTAGETEAAAAAAGCSFVLMAPATPKHGRTVLGGRLMVDGNPAIADLPGLLTQSDVFPYVSIPLEEVRQGPGRLAERLGTLRAAGIRRVVLDGETEADLRCAARALPLLEPGILLAGTSGFAAALADTRPGPVSAPPPPAFSTPVLFALGSCHAATRLQCARLLQLPDTAVVWLDTARCLAGQAASEAVHAADRCAGHFRAGAKAVVLAVDSLQPDAPEVAPSASGECASQAITAGLCEAVRRLLPEALFATLFLSGGDTAQQVLAGAGVDSLELQRELLPGIPLARARTGDGKFLSVITKSGGFGTPEALAEILHQGVCRK